METDAKLSFEPPLIDRGDDAAAQRYFLELLEYEVALLVVGLKWCGEVAGGDGETPTVGNKLGSRYESVLFEESSNYVLFRFGLFRPFVQWQTQWVIVLCPCIALAV